MVCCHHRRLKKPSELGVCKLENLDMSKLLTRIKEEYGINCTEIVDTFGAFKLADAFSAAGDEKYRQYLIPPRLNPSSIRKVISGSSLHFDEDKWKTQLTLSNLDSPTMLRAPTGWGKTTTSLLFFSKANKTRVFILLPTTTAIRKFREKLAEIFGEKNVKEYHYLYPAEIIEKEEVDSFKSYYFLKSLLSPIMITTVDQWILTFLQIGSYHVKRPAFRNAGVVFDEIHILSPVGLMLVSAVLKKFSRKYNLRCLMMSATFPKSYQDFLHKELHPYFEDRIRDYEKLRRIHYSLESGSIEEDLLNTIRDQMKKGLKVLITVNKVSTAIKLAKKLEKEFGEKQVILAHARYTYIDRLSWEKRIDEMLKRNLSHILISTQVCQVSLDVSYDFLITEISPFGDLIQRFGRVNRRGGPAHQRNVHIALDPIGGSLPYTESELEISRNILEKFEGDKLKSEIELIRELDTIYDKKQFYDVASEILGKENPETWYEELNKFLDELGIFSLDVQPKEISELLRPREFNLLGIVSPKICANQAMRASVESAIDDFYKRSGDFDERIKCLANLMRFLIPVPPSHLDYENLIAGFPQITKGKYTPEYGLELGEKDATIKQTT